MKHKIVSVSQAKAKLLELTRKVHEEGQAFLITKDGELMGALVPMSEYESWQETADVFANPSTMGLLEQALTDERKGRLWRRDRSGKWMKNKKKLKAA